MTQKLENFIGGSWVTPEVESWTPDVNPAYPDDVLAQIPLSARDQARAAADAATDAFEGWRRTSAVRRGEYLIRASRLLADRAEELARLVTREQGKVLAEARGEVARAAEFWSWMGHHGRSLQGVTAPSEADSVFAMTLREPIGPVALITPWNFPVNIPAWKLASALVCGNPVVLKPAQATPMCSAFLVGVLGDAGIPPGVVNLVHGSGSVVGQELIEHPGIVALSFTGSTEVGLAINAKAAALGKPVQAEMGGHNAVIVLDDADAAAAARGAAAAAFGTSGQRCTAARRVLVTPGVAAEMVELLRAETRRMRVGPGDTDADIGPMIDEPAVLAMVDEVEHARQEGAMVLEGGSRVPRKGFFFAPTLLGNVEPEMRIATEEVFGPILPVLRVADYDEALAIARSSRYGLSASIYTSDASMALRFAHDIDCGVVHVNKPPIGGEAHLPFGGAKSSALGPKEMGAAAEFFTQTKTVYWDYGAAG